MAKYMASVKNDNKANYNTRQYEMMVNNLIKVKKQEKLYLKAINKYKQLEVYKDYYVNFHNVKKNTGLSVRYYVGTWDQIEKILKSNSRDFGSLKDSFDIWFASVEPKDVTTKVNEIFQSTIENIPLKYKKRQNNLIDLIFTELKKTKNQQNGFEKKINQVYFKWLNESKELEKIEHIEKRINIDNYEFTFPLARALKREIIINIGPTNSGKTHESLNELSVAESGIYLAPLRLMASEGQESLTKRGVKTSLITGEECIEVEGANHISSTVEMCVFNKRVDIAVIDEIQMIADQHRGWAWTQALIGVSANKVILVGSEECLPYIMPIIESLGESFTINRFTRKTPLKQREPIWKLKELKKGDAVVVFSRKEALSKKLEIEGLGKTCSVIYGNLSPEVRRLEAERYRNGTNEIIVATDAIGMGLNLPIQRLFFNKLEKFDGLESRYLSISEVKQIAGRAGRYGFAKNGEVGLIADDRLDSKTLLNNAIYGGYEKVVDNRVFVSPNSKILKIICDNIDDLDIFGSLVYFKENLIKEHRSYKTANIENMLEVASIIRDIQHNFENTFIYCCVPLETSNELHLKTLFDWCLNHSEKKNNKAPDLPDFIKWDIRTPFNLFEAEIFVKLCTAYRWLHYKFPETYNELDEAIKNSNQANKYIENILTQNLRNEKKQNRKNYKNEKN